MESLKKPEPSPEDFFFKLLNAPLYSPACLNLYLPDGNPATPLFRLLIHCPDQKMISEALTLKFYVFIKTEE